MEVRIMAGRTIFRFGVFSLVALSALELARPGGVLAAPAHGGHGSARHHGAPGPHGGFFPGFGASGFYPVYSPILVIAPGGFLPTVPMILPPSAAGPGPLLPPPPPGLIAPPAKPKLERSNLKHSDPIRAGQLITVGDRLFRAGNLKKAEERYQQAMRAAADLAAPQARMAQVALARGNYSEAANRLREAEIAEPGWIITAPDIQSIYGEPGEFSGKLAQLESYLQVHPDDRDAWLVLGAEWFLTGRTAKAADVFKRLDDPRRKADVALAAFLAASNQAEAHRAKVPGQAGGPGE
jgi:hypothetical protein